MRKDETKKTKWVRRLLIAGLIIAGGAILLFATILQNNTQTVQINSTEIRVEIATTSQEKARGLCCRDSLPENSGMLFVYDQPGDYRFWMKDTRIPLDMYWISSEKKIVHIEHSVSPDSYPQRYTSPEPAQYILETNAGFAENHNIQIGDLVTF